MKGILSTFLIIGCASTSPDVVAWWRQGHEAIGVLAIQQVDAQTRLNLKTLLGSTWPDDIAAACNWPDENGSPGQTSADPPLHYLNIDPNANSYRRNRDCPDGRCVAEALIDFSEILADEEQAVQARREAFAYVCHLVGDLHQPMHVAYADDQGGSLVSVNYLGRRTNLHKYWDGEVLARHSNSWQDLVVVLNKRPQQQPPRWQAGQVQGWTNETFTFTRNFGYPAQRDIDPAFEEKSWQVIQQQLDVAASRLAALLEAVLGGALAPELNSELANDAEPDDGATQAGGGEQPGR